MVYGETIGKRLMPGFKCLILGFRSVNTGALGPRIVNVTVDSFPSRMMGSTWCTERPSGSALCQASNASFSASTSPGFAPVDPVGERRTLTRCGLRNTSETVTALELEPTYKLVLRGAALPPTTLT